MYRSYHIFLMLLKLNYYFFEVFAIQFLVLVLKPNDVEYALTIIGIIIALPIVVFAIYAVRGKALPSLAPPARRTGWLTVAAAVQRFAARCAQIRLEKLWMVTIWLVILILMVAYFIFKIARMYDPTQQWKYVGSIRFLTFFGTPPPPRSGRPLRGPC